MVFVHRPSRLEKSQSALQCSKADSPQIDLLRQRSPIHDSNTSTIFSGVFRNCHMSSHTAPVVQIVCCLFWRASLFRYVIRVVSDFQYIPSLSFLHSSFSGKEVDLFFLRHSLCASASELFDLTSTDFPHEFDTFAFTSHRSTINSTLFDPHHFAFFGSRPRPGKYEQCQMSLQRYDS